MFEKLKAVFEGPAGRDARDDFWFMPIQGASSSGVHVTAETAMAISAFYSGVRLISETAGQLPLQIFRRLDNGDKEEAPSHHLYDLLHDQANEEHTAQEFREMLTAWAVTRGTGMAEIIPGTRGSVEALVPLYPDWVRPVKVQDSSGRTQWQVEYREPGAPVRRLLREELFILRALSINRECPLLGLDPITVQANTLGANVAASDYAARFFRNDARPSLAITHPGHFKDQQSRETWLRAFMRKFAGQRRHGPMLLEWGMDIKQLSVTPEQAQFLETRKLQAEDVARILRVQPHKIGIMEHATFGNIEHQAIEFVQDTMMPWLVRWEQSVKRDLMTRRQFFAEHNVAGLLRGDQKTRYESYALGRNWGFLSVNEIRRRENLNSVGPDGDIYLQPLNMVEAGEEPPEPTVVEPEPEPEDDVTDEEDAQATARRRLVVIKEG